MKFFSPRDTTFVKGCHDAPCEKRLEVHQSTRPRPPIDKTSISSITQYYCFLSSIHTKRKKTSFCLDEYDNRWKLRTRADIKRYQTQALILPSGWVYWYQFGSNLHQTSSPALHRNDETGLNFSSHRSLPSSHPVTE